MLVLGTLYNVSMSRASLNNRLHSSEEASIYRHIQNIEIKIIVYINVKEFHPIDNVFFTHDYGLACIFLE